MHSIVPKPTTFEPSFGEPIVQAGLYPTTCSAARQLQLRGYVIVVSHARISIHETSEAMGRE